jgi:hypothetical protein
MARELDATHTHTEKTSKGFPFPFFGLLRVSNADAEGLGTTISPHPMQQPLLNFSFIWLSAIHKMTNDTWHNQMCHTVTSKRPKKMSKLQM